ncbi:jmjC domain-containing protein 8 isoform X1 [Caretta caretta]|uniref:jmjC domain-containing protein 8 isoform X1 n=1 Tax=Caretta caretta TaxID=8467 RepID=UPI003F4CA59D
MEVGGLWAETCRHQQPHADRALHLRRVALFQPASLRESDTPDSRGLLGANGIVVAIPSPIHPIVAAWRLRLPGRKWGLADEQVFGSDGRRPLHGGEERCFPDLLPVHRPICLFQACCYPGNHGQRGIPGALHKEQAAGRVRGPPVDVPFQEYVEHLLEPQDLASLGSDTLYFFGDNNFTEWGSLFQKYMPPPFRIPGTSGAYSFGIAGSGSGVPFHWHGPGYSEVIFGRKRWFLYPPEKTPKFHPNKTTLSWLLDTYPFLPPEDRPVECTIHPGEVLYFPDRWWHATLNLDTSVFISTFLG